MEGSEDRRSPEWNESEMKYSQQQDNNSSNGVRWKDKTVEDCSHIYSNGTNVNSLFDTREDKIGGMNMLAILAYSLNVKILVQQIMTTHIHLIASGTSCDRYRYAREIQRRLMIMASRKKHSTNGRIIVGNDEIKTERELMSKFMYVYRNAIVAGYPGMPWDYIGGPGNIFFGGQRNKHGQPLDDLPVLARREMLHSKIEPPKGWLYNSEGLVLPECYVDWRRVEKLFKNPKVFIAFLHQSKSVESEIDLECSREYVLSISEKELREESRSLCMRMFGKATPSKANLEDRIAIAQRLWADKRTYSVNALSRVTMVPQSVLEAIFGGKA